LKEINYVYLGGNERKIKIMVILILQKKPLYIFLLYVFFKVDLETAQRHLSQILSVKPTSWEALAQLIEVQWRRGKLPESEQALDAAKLALGDQDDSGKCLGFFTYLHYACETICTFWDILFYCQDIKYILQKSGWHIEDVDLPTIYNHIPVYIVGKQINYITYTHYIQRFLFCYIYE
jgi:hypothetical protein